MLLLISEERLHAMIQQNNPQNKQQFNKYLETQIQTASPVQLICMLYDGAIKFANLALIGIKEKNIEKKTVNIIKVENILNELRTSLNFDKGGEIAKNLDKLYEYMYTCMMEANSNDDPAKIDNVLKILSSLRESWISISKGQAPAQQKQTVMQGTVKQGTKTPGTEERLDLAC